MNRCMKFRRRGWKEIYIVLANKSHKFDIVFDVEKKYVRVIKRIHSKIE